MVGVTGIPLTGSTASFNSIGAQPNSITITGLTNIVAGVVGQLMTFSGAHSSANNGSFRVVAYNSPTSIDIYSPSGVYPDINNGVISWSVSVSWGDGSIFTVSGAAIPNNNGSALSGNAASFASAGTYPSTITVTGLTGMRTGLVGQSLTISGAYSPSNNGSFPITAYNSPFSVDVYIPSGVVPDVNNGALSWSINGTFKVTAYNSATSVDILDPMGTYPDANNGAISWSTGYLTYTFNVTASVSPALGAATLTYIPRDFDGLTCDYCAASKVLCTIEADSISSDTTPYSNYRA